MAGFLKFDGPDVVEFAPTENEQGYIVEFDMPTCKADDQDARGTASADTLEPFFGEFADLSSGAEAAQDYPDSTAGDLDVHPVLEMCDLIA